MYDSFYIVQEKNLIVSTKSYNIFYDICRAKLDYTEAIT